MNNKTLLWVGLGIAALYIMGRNQASAAAGGGLGPMPGNGGYGYGSPGYGGYGGGYGGGSPWQQIGSAAQQLFNYAPGGMNTGSPTAG